MDKELLKAIAKTILTKFDGHGRWLIEGDFPRFQKIENPVKGLKVGDVVFTYDEDDEEIQERQVLAVVDGIGYVMFNSHYYGPRLFGVSEEAYGKTAKEAAEAARGQIEADIEYAQDMYERMMKVKAIIGQ